MIQLTHQLSLCNQQLLALLYKVRRVEALQTFLWISTAKVPTTNLSTLLRDINATDPPKLDSRGSPWRLKPF